jgi:hypothetical protein
MSGFQLCEFHSMGISRSECPTHLAADFVDFCFFTSEAVRNGASNSYLSVYYPDPSYIFVICRLPLECASLLAPSPFTRFPFPVVRLSKPGLNGKLET